MEDYLGIHAKPLTGPDRQASKNAEEIYKMVKKSCIQI